MTRPAARRLILGAALIVVTMTMGLWSALVGCSGDTEPWPSLDEGDAPPSVVTAPAGLRGPLDGRGHAIHVGGVHDLSCDDCHNIKPDGFERPTAGACRRCHDITVTMHATPAGAVATGCTTCHSFLPRDGDERDPWICMDCHAAAQGERPAVVVHSTNECGQCHRPHDEPSIAPRGCLSCHKGERAPKHRLHAVGPDKPCLSCHHPHRLASESLKECASCHREKEPLVPASALFSSGHTDCTLCHSAHDDGVSKTVACRSCHDKQTTLAAEKAPEHASCKSCHKPHAVRTGTRASCVGCHASAHGDQALDYARTCLGCHPIHPSVGMGRIELASMQPSCTRCHKQALSDSDVHAPTMTCKSCHSGHVAAAQPTAPCANCHRSVATAVAYNQGHTDCRRCHEPHRPTVAVPACATCHVEQGQSTPDGHTACATCHDRHSGVVGPSCASCHEDRKQGPHEAVKDGCRSCHRPHGPGGIASPPSCTSCHPANRLPGLHVFREHKRCAKCHGGHARPRSDRATCLPCHENRKGHFPEANDCKGCHLFGGFG